MRSGEHHECRLLDELKEFASFTTAEQRYIRCSLEVSTARADATEHWARGPGEAAEIGRQAKVYADIERIRSLIPVGLDEEDASALLGPLIVMSAFDLERGKFSSFAAYRFLYERLIGPAVRPWLVSAFAAAAALPSIHPELRAELFASLRCEHLAAAGWSAREPIFFPEWIEKVPVAS
ncbi:hypothetical protein ACFQPG_01865 [Sphingomonas sp. GCM10030256]|uniref:hypothetical protein n=1 Tax=Sphingomonas sp. GCM10030256 TaxID=3273427 RepID=UPI00361A6016